jgi:hypothetical protein
MRETGPKTGQGFRSGSEGISFHQRQFFGIRTQDLDEEAGDASLCPSSFQTTMAISGHICAHNAQPLHISGAATFAGKYPLELNSLSMTMTPLGHASTQYLHPLHNSLLMAIFPFI